MWSCALCPVFLSPFAFDTRFFFPITMNFDAAAALKLFTDGHVGASLLNSLPAEAFPDDGSTWNHFAAVMDENRVALRNNTFSSPATSTTLLKHTPSP
jgi:hypothetical protein